MFTVTVHVAAPAGTFRFVTVIVLPPATVAAAALLHVPPTFAGLATCNPAGRVSTKPTFDNAPAPVGLVTLNVRTETPPALMVVGLKLLSSAAPTTPVEIPKSVALATVARLALLARVPRNLPNKDEPPSENIVPPSFDLLLYPSTGRRQALQTCKGRLKAANRRRAQVCQKVRLRSVADSFTNFRAIGSERRCWDLRCSRRTANSR